MSRLSISALLTFALLLAACGESSEVQFTVETRDGVPHAINRGTNVWTDSVAAPLQFTREQTYGTAEGPKETMLARPWDLSVGEDGTVYVLDRGNHRLVAFAPDGAVRWTAGGGGAGPGGLQSPWAVVVMDNRLFVSSQGGRSIDVWTTDGTFVDRHSFQETPIGPPGVFGAAGRQLVASKMSGGAEPHQIHLIDANSIQVRRSFPLDLGLDLPVDFPLQARVAVLEDTIYASGITQYALSLHTLDGTLARRITRDAAYPMKPAVYESRRANYSSMRAPLKLASGHLLVGSTWATNVDDPNAYLRRDAEGSADPLTFATALDVIAPGGRYLGSLRWTDRQRPPTGTLQEIGPKGNLYTTANQPFPQVRRYDVLITEP